MTPSVESYRFECPKRLAFVYTYVGVVGGVALSAFLVGTTFISTTMFFRPDPLAYFGWLGLVGMTLVNCLAASFVLYQTTLAIRTRYALFTRYVIDASGISVTDADGRASRVTWPDVQSVLIRSWGYGSIEVISDKCAKNIVLVPMGVGAISTRSRQYRQFLDARSFVERTAPDYSVVRRKF
jgi:hypothetical protein